ncbi:MAG: oligoendopeptidase F [bacterium]|nr:oligoendopeptidase F [bacterium]
MVAERSLNRADISDKYKWNEQSVFPTRQAWRDEFQAVNDAIPSLEAFKGRLHEGAGVLADYVEVTNPLALRLSTLYMYAVFAMSVDTADAEAIGFVGQMGGLLGRFSAAASFADPEMIAIGKATLDQWIAAEPRLTHLAHYVENLFRQQAHVRSAEVEEVLGLAVEPLSAIDDPYDQLTNTDLKFADAVDSAGAKHPVLQSTWETLRQSPDRALRRTALESYADGYLAFKNTMTGTYLAAIKRDVFNARARRYPSALEASLAQYNIPVDVFHTLIETYKKHIPTWHKYWEVKKRILGVDVMRPYDIWAPVTAQEPVVSYEQAVEMITAGMSPLGSEYTDPLRRGLTEERWVDVYPNTGKRQGAFSYGTQATHPFIMTSYNDTLFGMSVLAHELGHSMHSYFTWKNQPYVYADYSLFVAEVASNFNQAMVRAHLMNTQTDPQFQIALINEAMYNLHRYFFIMPILAQFELEAHQRVEQGQPVTADSLIELCADLFEAGYGGVVQWERERIGITWAQFSHLYANFYVYQYATGISAAHALAAPILAGEAGAAERYLNFLKAGSSVYPVDALKLAGVDMRQPTAVERTFETLAGYVARLDELTR